MREREAARRIMAEIYNERHSLGRLPEGRKRKRVNTRERNQANESPQALPEEEMYALAQRIYDEKYGTDTKRAPEEAQGSETIESLLHRRALLWRKLADIDKRIRWLKGKEAGNA